MAKIHILVTHYYDRFVLKYPKIIILGILAAVCFLGYKAADFRLDASTETLIIETDEDLRYSRLIQSRYGGYDYLLITYSPKTDLFSNESLKKLAQLRDDLKKTKRVTSVVSILDAPLLESPPVPVKELATGLQTLESGDRRQTGENRVQRQPAVPKSAYQPRYEDHWSSGQFPGRRGLSGISGSQ